MPILGTDCPRIFICGPRDVGAVPQARRLRRHIRDAMDKTSTTDRQGKTLTFASTKPRVSSAGGAEDTLAPPSDAHDTSRSTHPAEAATEPRSRNRAGRRRVIIAVAVLALVAVVIGARYYAWALRHEGRTTPSSTATWSTWRRRWAGACVACS